MASVTRFAQLPGSDMRRALQSLLSQTPERSMFSSMAMAVLNDMDKFDNGNAASYWMGSCLKALAL